MTNHQKYESMKRTLEGFRGFTDCLKGIREKGVIYGTGVWHKGEIHGKAAMKEAFQFGNRI